MKEKTKIAYIRVSTQRQGVSGLGIDAQEAVIAPHNPIRSYVEIESGKKSERPELIKALADCKRTNSTLVIAKLDRLSRNVRFLLTLVENEVDVLFCDLPQIPSGAMGRFILTQMAAVAELEAGLISERTKSALAECKKRGVLLGSRREGAHRFKGGGSPLAAKRSGERSTELAREAYFDIRPRILALRDAGHSLHSSASTLNAEGHKTRRGKEWNAVQVRRVLRMVA